jgi:hypothetical protein
MNTRENGSSSLKTALAWWRERDEFGGFASVGSQLFPQWQPRHRGCHAPHRQDAHPSFSIYRSPSGAWRFKDHGGDGAQGGLVDFVMLSGKGLQEAIRWLVNASRNDEIRMTNAENGALRHEAVGGCGRLTFVIFS